MYINKPSVTKIEGAGLVEVVSINKQIVIRLKKIMF